MDLCESGAADGIVVTRLDRLCRSLVSWAFIVERAKRSGFDLVVLEQGFELNTSQGRAMAGMLAVFAQFERELIGERTRAAMQALPREKRGGPAYGDEVRLRARELRAGGLTLSAIGEQLQREGVSPVRGGYALHPRTVSRLLTD
jgi:DNA invertase Pin-like site-specific DNA recombinase